ncbi:MAG: hypothetical protein MZV49_08890 [Rhodopseudomonas palustris]|nr:hypothetical protein [Rhodopseudomonas palustris]
MPVSVKLTAELSIEAVDAGRLYAGSSRGEVTVRGSGFLADTVARLESRGISVAAVPVHTDRGSADFVFDPAKTLPGDYSLVLENGGAAPARWKVPLAVLPRVQPRFESITPRVAGNDRVYAEVRIKGSGFSAETEVILRGGPGRQEIKPFRVVSAAADELVVSINLAERAAGAYDVVLANPGGLEAAGKSALVVRDVLAGVVPSDLPASPQAPPATGTAAKTPADAAAQPGEAKPAPDTAKTPADGTARPAEAKPAPDAVKLPPTAQRRPPPRNPCLKPRPRRLSTRQAHHGGASMPCRRLSRRCPNHRRQPPPPPRLPGTANGAPKAAATAQPDQPAAAATVPPPSGTTAPAAAAVPPSAGKTAAAVAPDTGLPEVAALQAPALAAKAAGNADAASSSPDNLPEPDGATAPSAPPEPVRTSSAWNRDSADRAACRTGSRLDVGHPAIRRHR